MIKIENVHTCNWEAAIRGMRNPMNSWDKSDSYYTDGVYILGPNDLKLAKQLATAGSDHGKFLRMIIFSCDITAPLYWISEFDTYKVSTVRNSCSFQHKGVSKSFSISDFSVDDLVQEILEPIYVEKEHHLVYNDDYDIGEFKVGDRKYTVYSNGRIFSTEFSRTNNKGVTRHYKAKELKPHKMPSGYYELNLGGRLYREKWFLHRIVAEVFMKDSYKDGYEINHKDGNKGNNNVDNLEWVTRSENMLHAFENGLSVKTPHVEYEAWKRFSLLTPEDRWKVKRLYNEGYSQKDLSKIFNVSQSTISSIIRGDGAPLKDLFEEAWTWEKMLSHLNSIRDNFIENDDYDDFVNIRRALPSSYLQKFTWTANYEVLRNIYHSRKNHKLDEWHDFCDMIEELPYSELITEKR